MDASDVILAMTLGALLVALFASFMSFGRISFSSHHDMTKGNSPYQKEVDFSSFLDEFVKVDWKVEMDWKYSFFSDDNSKNYIHAGIIKVNGVGLLIKDYSEFKKIMNLLGVMWECYMRKEG